MEAQPPPKGQHQKSYPVEFKLQVLDWYYSNGKNKLKTATHFNVHTKRIRDWELNEAFLRAHSDSPRRRFRMEKAAADTYGNIGKSLFQWYVEEKALGTEHTFGDLKSKAVQLAAELNVQASFTVSDSWVRRWRKKYGVEDAGAGRRRGGGRGGSGGAMVLAAGGTCEEGVVEVDARSGNIMETTASGEVITLPGILQVETDGSGESIVYVSEPQPLAHPSEEVIDMVENPITTDAQGAVQQMSDGVDLQQSQPMPPQTETSLTISEPVELQPQSITLGSTLLEHLLMSLNETKKKLDQQEQLTKQAILRAEDAEKEINICKSRLTVLELAMHHQARLAGGSLTDSLVSPSSLPLSLPLINSAAVAAAAVAAITETVTTSSLSTSDGATN